MRTMGATGCSNFLRFFSSFRSLFRSKLSLIFLFLWTSLFRRSLLLLENDKCEPSEHGFFNAKKETKINKRKNNWQEKGRSWHSRSGFDRSFILDRRKKKKKWKRLSRHGESGHPGWCLRRRRCWVSFFGAYELFSHSRSLKELKRDNLVHYEVVIGRHYDLGQGGRGEGADRVGFPAAR